MTIDQYAVFGNPINHSKSPQIHKQFAHQTGQSLNYSAQQVPTEQFDYAVDHFFQQGGAGLNCTVPLKELAWKKADVLTESARLAQAVNTLIKLENGEIKGDNTDGKGLVKDITENHQLSLSNKQILILGAGGATRGIMASIMLLSPETLYVANRAVSKALQIAEQFSELSQIQVVSYEQLSGLHFDLILNATSASLTGQLPPLPDGLLAAGGSCYDLAYANEDTAFVRWGKQQQAHKSLDGLGMLVEQAAAAFFLWRGVFPETAPVIQRLNSER